LDLQNPQVGLPAVEFKEGVVIEAQSGGKTLTGNSLIEHQAQTRTVECHGLHPEADDSAGVDIHDQQHPVSLQQDRLGPK
jgi:hypothetical protein